MLDKRGGRHLQVMVTTGYNEIYIKHFARSIASRYPNSDLQAG
jgi:hypothetical protein